MQIAEKTKSILVLDDDPDLLDVVGLYLEEAGFKPLLCNDPLQTEKYLEETQIQAVICDYNMPQRNGLECLRLIRKKLGDQFPVLLMTGFKQISQQRAKGEGFSAYLEKPFDAPTILKSLNKELHKFQLVDPIQFESIHLDGLITSPPGMKSTHNFTLLEFNESEIIIEVRKNILKEGIFCKLELHTQFGKRELTIPLEALVLECPAPPVDPITQEETNFVCCRLKIKGATELLLQRLQEMYIKKQEAINEFFRQAKGF